MATLITPRTMYNASGERKIVNTLEEKTQLETEGWTRRRPRQTNE
jgi:hypothetical protein